jgi:hypothetical protein
MRVGASATPDGAREGEKGEGERGERLNFEFRISSFIFSLLLHSSSRYVPIFANPMFAKTTARGPPERRPYVSG